MISHAERNAAILDDYRTMRSYRAVGKKYGLCGQRIKQIADMEVARRARVGPEDWTLDTLIAETTLSFRIRCMCREHGTTFGEVLTEAGQRNVAAMLLRLPNFGRKSYLELKAAMASKGWMI